jgi:hypothetical protein
MKDRLGQPFVIENRSGASGNVRIDAVAKSAPDSYAIGATDEAEDRAGAKAAAGQDGANRRGDGTVPRPAVPSLTF